MSDLIEKAAAAIYDVLPNGGMVRKTDCIVKRPPLKHRIKQAWKALTYDQT